MGTNPKRLETLQSLVIHINNLNDNSPKFEQESYSFKILENTPVGTVIGQLSAIDLDADAILHYELIDIDLFYIDFLTGQLHTKVLLDYETNSTYHFSALVKDNDNLHSARVLITIELIDINDNPPIIDIPSSISISDDLLHTNLSKTMVITSIRATDRDSGANGNLTYTIIDGNQNDYFRINIHNGTITGERTKLPRGYHRLIIKVCDQGELFEKCSTKNLHIQIGENVEKYFYTNEQLEKKELIEEENLFTNQILLVVIISSLFTLVVSITMGILCAICCKQKRYHRSSLKKSCELLQSTDADKLLSTNKVNDIKKKGLRRYLISTVRIVTKFRLHNVRVEKI